jgi:hypothetical protein
MRVKTPYTWRMKPLPSKSAKVAGKKRGREEAAAAATGAAPRLPLEQRRRCFHREQIQAASGKSQR